MQTLRFQKNGFKRSVARAIQIYRANRSEQKDGKMASFGCFLPKRISPCENPNSYGEPQHLQTASGEPPRNRKY